jgi:hypothetical protein
MNLLSAAKRWRDHACGTQSRAFQDERLLAEFTSNLVANMPPEVQEALQNMRGSCDSYDYQLVALWMKNCIESEGKPS